MKRFLSVFILILPLLPLTVQAAAGKGSIRGVTLNRITREPVQNANVEVFGTKYGAASDSLGQFRVIGLNPGTYTLQAGALGYRMEVKSDLVVVPGRAAEVEFLLEPAPVEAPEVVIKTGYYRPAPDLPTSSRGLHWEEVRRAPGAAEDVQRAIQALPGVAGANDQTNEIVVRGGDPTENLTSIDGIEIENVNHFPNQSASGGPISAVNIAFLKDVTFTTGGFSARYGDKLSSVLNLDLREGSRERILGQAELSMAGAGLDVEGPLAEGRGSFLASARKSYLDLIQGPIGLTAVPHYWDTQFKAVYDLSPKSKVSLFGMATRDWIAIESEEEDAWSRGAESVDARYNRLVFGTRLRQLKTNGYQEWVGAWGQTSFNEKVWEMPERREIFHNNSTETIDQLHYLWSGRAGQSDEWSAGFSLKPLTFKYDMWYEQDTTTYDLNNDGLPDTTVLQPPWIVNRSQTALKTGAFIQYHWRPAHQYRLTLGLRYEGLDLSRKSYLAPRTSFRWDLTGNTAFNLAIGRYYQSHSLLIYSYDPEGGNEKLPHTCADHYIAGLTRILGAGCLVSLEVYYKDYRSLPVSEEQLMRKIDPTFRSWRYSAVGKKRAAGVEFFLQQKKIRNWYGTLSYSCGRATFDNSQEKIPADYDFRHVGTVVVGWTTNLIKYDWFNQFQRAPWGWWTYLLPLNGDELTLSSRWRYVSGRPYTRKVWTEEGLEWDEHWEDSNQINNDRYPYYSRLDIRTDTKWFAGRTSVVVYLEIQNLLNRANVAEYIYADDGKRDTAYQFRFFFVGGVRVEF